MKKILVLSILAFYVIFGASATSYTTIPQPVMDWYAETMGVFANLAKALADAKDAPAAAKAFNDASGEGLKKGLSGKYRLLQKQYPDLFDGPIKATKDWVPPKDWVKTQSDYKATMKSFGTDVQTAMQKFGKDVAVQTSVKRFQNFLESLSPKAPTPPRERPAKS